jgi:predicted SAM-dependent methyltransferase
MYKEFKQFIYRRLIPLIKIWRMLSWGVYLKTHNKINLIVGAGPTRFKGWFPTDIVTLDITNEGYFQKYFNRKKIDKILAEHVLEHLTDREIDLMINNFYIYSIESVNIRIAVPDGFHKDEDYINTVKPGGTGDGAADHKQLFNHKTLSGKFEKFGFISYPKEYWDEKGNFHSKYINDEFGIIQRSFLNDFRNKDKLPHYTSLIIDFRKK